MNGEYDKKVSLSGFEHVSREKAGRYNIIAAREKEDCKNTVKKDIRKTAGAFFTDRLIRNTAICAVCALVVFGIANSNSPEAQATEEVLRQVVAYDFDEDDIGMLKFVNDETSTGAKEVLAAAEEFVYPLDGIVTTTFAQNGSGAIITATGSTQVISSRSGIVNTVADNYVSVRGENGALTTYFGVAGSVAEGDSVAVGQEIGTLLSDVLYVEQDVDGEKTDPFN